MLILILSQYQMKVERLCVATEKVFSVALLSYDHLSSVLVSVTVIPTAQGHLSLRARCVVWEKDRCRGEAGGHCVLCVLRRLFRSRRVSHACHDNLTVLLSYPRYNNSLVTASILNHKINDLKCSTLPRFLHNHVTVDVLIPCVTYFYT